MKLLLVQCIQLIEKSIVNLLAVQILIPLNLLRHDETYLFFEGVGHQGDAFRIVVWSQG